MKPPRGSPATQPQSPGGARELPVLPHERDQRTRGAIKHDPSMLIAADDLAEGQVDTDCRSATPTAACAGVEVSRPPKPRRAG
jgi:hypothetical protein